MDKKWETFAYPPAMTGPHSKESGPGISNAGPDQLEQLLGRSPVRLDNDALLQGLEGKTVLVTGGGGSIGSELCRQLVRFHPRQLFILDIYENNAYDLQQELLLDAPDCPVQVLIGSIRDADRMERIFRRYRPQVVFHAAAHKHVPLMEDNPQEAVKNNVFGTYHVMKCADKYRSEKFVLISTDKAVNPTSIMGATKRICEMMAQLFDADSKTDFVAVRFGNVLGSNGSVVPLFYRQIRRGGPVLVTHPDVVRFFMTVSEAAQLVLQASVYAQGGEIFVLDMGKPVKIYELAEKMIRQAGLVPGKDIKIEITGLRPGEKMHEELAVPQEHLYQTAHDQIFVIRSASPDRREWAKSMEEMKTMIEKENLTGIEGVFRRLIPSFRHTLPLGEREEMLV